MNNIIKIIYRKIFPIVENHKKKIYLDFFLKYIHIQSIP